MPILSTDRLIQIIDRPTLGTDIDTARSTTMGKLKLDLHDIYDKGEAIDAELERVIDEAVDKKIKLVEIIHGKGSGQLKKRVLKYLDQPHIKAKYHRLDKDERNHGRLFLRFKH